ncbi:hypothetical protein GC106_25110 [Kibdelosporangium sp. 4NS15]|uniref:Uncharacterized protein n=1 Tax=Kibdelosporangium persicum TaxID=2698649 RepID=A0ABX2F2S0_9PSEU|nr:hypothetical protein [Kibdelosporangium persicum]NRN65300.1 hypothetical protein [Kibdelosporangium persicum]
MTQIIRKDLERDWVSRGERVRVALGSRLRVVGSRIAGRVQVPHPVADDAPQSVDLEFEPPLTSDFAAEGRFTGFEWTDDDSIGWWAEAQDPGQDAVLAADAMAGCKAESGFALTDRRVAVIFPERLLVSHRESRKKGLVGQALAAANDWAFSSNHWSMRDKVVSLWETDARRVRGWTRLLAGRSFPFAELVRIDFVDGSALFTLRHKLDYVEGLD